MGAGSDKDINGMSWLKKQKLDLSDSVESKEREKIPPSYSEEQVDKIIQELHGEKNKNSELKQTNEQLLATIDEKDKKLKDLVRLLDSVGEKVQESSDEVSESRKQMTDVDSQRLKDAEPKREYDKQQDPVIQHLIDIRELLELRVKELIEDRIKLSDELSNKNSRYQELLDRIQEDRYRKDKVKILRRNINMRNLISSVLDEYRNEDPCPKGYDTPAAIFLEKQLDKIIEKLDADLRQEMLVPLVNGKEGSNFDAEYQEIVERQPTNCLELDGKVYKSVAPGYVWTLPYIFKPRINEKGEEIHTYKFLLRSEDVITYKYEEKEINNK